MGAGSWAGIQVVAALSSRSTACEVVQREFRGAVKTP